jgi:hypothetical protein
VWWSDAHFELRSGSPGNILGTDGNVLFRSDRINFSTLPPAGTFIGSPMFELTMSNVGLAGPIEVTPNATYYLALVDTNGSGEAFFAENQANPYPDGTKFSHGRESAPGSGPRHLR